MKLLIAEDEKDLAEALSVFLEKNLYTVDTVHNGADAYEYASTGAYDAIILDIMMPKLNGLQVLSRLREDGVATPVMLLTAKGQKDDRIAGFDAGADDYLPKPFAPDELLLKAARDAAPRRGIPAAAADGGRFEHGVRQRYALLRHGGRAPERARVSGDGAADALPGSYLLHG